MPGGDLKGGSAVGAEVDLQPNDSTGKFIEVLQLLFQCVLSRVQDIFFSGITVDCVLI